jgi:hypothetical protein
MPNPTSCQLTHTIWSRTRVRIGRQSWIQEISTNPDKSRSLKNDARGVVKRRRGDSDGGGGKRSEALTRHAPKKTHIRGAQPKPKAKKAKKKPLAQ